YTATLSVANGFGAASATADFSLVPKTATAFFTVRPCRALDTRIAGPALVTPGPPRVIAVGGVCGVPATARAVAVNVTTVGPTADGFVSVYPADFAHATTSLVNFRAGSTRANNAVLPLSTDGMAELAAAPSLVRPGSVHLIVDIVGYFMSASGPPLGV